MNSFSEGRVILINKPYHWTSFDVVNKIKGIIKKTANKESPKPNLKVGHAGTLDPLATGLLIICTGKFTKRIEEFQVLEKEYTGTMCLGATTPCFDLEQPIDKYYPVDHITEAVLLGTAKKFTGNVQQVPPIFSAVKINGKRAYDLARKGETPEITTKTVYISAFEINNISLPHLSFRVTCSKGTYIRSLVRDFALDMGSGAHLTALCRTRIGQFRIEQALEIEQFENQLKLSVG
jgi:tRNA pseudouridine55 synthase